MSHKLRITSVIVIAILLVGALGYAAFAQTTHKAGTSKWAVVEQSFVSKLAANLGLDQTKVSTALDAIKQQMHQGGKSAPKQSFASELATSLGVDQSQVTTALDATKKQMLDEAVQQGKLTQDQADKIASGQHPTGTCCKGSQHVNKGQKPTGGTQQFHGKFTDGFASILGITADQLQTELKSGKKLSQIVTEHGMTMDQFKQKMIDYRKSQGAKK